MQDGKEKHKKFCKEDADERKVKCGAKERKENKMYNMSILTNFLNKRNSNIAILRNLLFIFRALVY